MSYCYYSFSESGNLITVSNWIDLLVELTSRVGLIIGFSVHYREKSNSSRTNLLVHLAKSNNKILEVIPRASKHFCEKAEPTDM